MMEQFIFVPKVDLLHKLDLRYIHAHDRYNILAAKAMADAKSDKSAAKALFEMVGLESEKYRLGHTKVQCLAILFSLKRVNKVALF